jgi:hypothetical protein
MSKLASGVEGTTRAHLEALVAQGDTSVPNIEAADLNDGDILARTRENVNPNGLFQFVYIPDDGSENVTSDWIDQEHKKKVTRQWVDGVKAEIIGRAQRPIIEAREKAIEAKARRVRDEQLADKPSDSDRAVTDTKVQVDIPKSARPQVPVLQPVQHSTDPSDYVGDQLELARERLRGAEMAQQDIVREVLSARRDYDKWKALAAALSGVGDDALRNGDQSGGQAAGGAESAILQNAGRSGGLRIGNNLRS